MHNKITKLQAAVAAEIVSGDIDLTTDQILSKYGVSPAKYAEWLDDGRYLEYLLSLSQIAAAAEEPRILRALIDLSKNKEIRAIKLYFDLQSKNKSGGADIAVPDEITALQNEIWGNEGGTDGDDK